MPLLTFELITPEGIKFEDEVYEVILPTPTGQIGILPHHIPLVSIASAGVISVRTQRENVYFYHLATSGGLIVINGKHVRLLADTAERAEDIDELRAKQALEHARELKKTAQDHISLADATRLIERNVARLRVAELHRHHHQ